MKNHSQYCTAKGIATLIFLLLGGAASSFAGETPSLLDDDFNPAAVPDGMIWPGNTDIYYFDSDGKLQSESFDYKDVKDAYFPNHCTTDEDTDLQHLHWKAGNSLGEFEAGVGTYWRHVFSRCTPVQGSKPGLQHNCHSYAFDTIMPDGAYNYAVRQFGGNNGGFHKLYDDATIAIAPQQVQINDLLSYDAAHTSIVTAVNANKPSGLKWKWSWSQIFTYAPPAGHEFDTPWCDKINEIGKTIEEHTNLQWDPDRANDGDVHRDDGDD